VVAEKHDIDLEKTLRQNLEKADERDIAWLQKWHNVRTQSGFFNLSEKRMRKAISDLRGLIIGRDIREHK